MAKPLGNENALRVYVMRHGYLGRRDPAADPGWLRDDPKLAPLGREQAARLGRRLKELEPGAPPPLFASPLYRTSETAQIVAEILDCRFRAEPGIMELCLPRMHAAFRGLKEPDARAAFARLDNPERLREQWWPAQPETAEGCCARVAQTLARFIPLWRAEGARAVALVGHGASCDAAVEFLAGKGAVSEGHMHCGLSLVLLSGAPPGTAEFVNCAKHLEGVLSPESTPKKEANG